MNKVILMGRLTRDPEIRYTQSGQEVGRYTLAVNRTYRREGEQQQADFINITTFSNRAEFAKKYFRKGMMVAVCGELRTGSYEKDGTKHYTTDVIASDQYFAESRSVSEGRNQNYGDSMMDADFAPASDNGSFYGNGYASGASQNYSRPAPQPQAQPSGSYSQGSTGNFSPEGFTPVEAITEDADLPF